MASSDGAMPSVEIAAVDVDEPQVAPRDDEGKHDDAEDSPMTGDDEGGAQGGADADAVGADESDSEMDCPLCYEVFASPINTPCRHTFCRQCLVDSLVYKLECPMCRGDLRGFDAGAVPVDAAKDAIVRERYRERWAAHEAAIDAEMARRARVRRVAVRVGNLHTKLAGRKQKNSHEWTAYVRTEDGSSLAGLVNTVTFELHPTFQNPTIRRVMAPFEVKKQGWGEFEIDICIKWFKGARTDGRTTTKLSHMLRFDAPDTYSVHVFECDATAARDAAIADPFNRLAAGRSSRPKRSRRSAGATAAARAGVDAHAGAGHSGAARGARAGAGRGSRGLGFGSGGGGGGASSGAR